MIFSHLSHLCNIKHTSKFIMATTSIDIVNMSQESLCIDCENKTKYFEEERTLCKKILANHWVDEFVENYKVSRDKFVHTYFPREEFFEYDITIQCQILKRVASLLNDYKLHRCSPVFVGHYFELINSQNDDLEYVHEFDFENCLHGDEGDDFFKHTEHPGINIYVCSPQVMHRPVMVNLLNYIAKGLYTIGEVEISNEYYKPQPSSVTGHRLFPIWNVNRDIPTLIVNDFRMCFQFVSCPSFKNCVDWLDVADLLRCHVYMDTAKVISPSLDKLYDKDAFLLPTKIDKGDVTFKTIWEEASSKRSHMFFSRIIFGFLNNQIALQTDTQTETPPQSCALLINWNIIKKEVCRNAMHERILKRSSRPFNNISECNMACAKYLQDNNIQMNTDTYVKYTMSMVNRYYLENGLQTLEDVFHEHVLNHPVAFTWQLNKLDVICPHPDSVDMIDMASCDPADDSDEEDSMGYTDAIGDHIVEVMSGNHWFNSLEECLENFHTEMSLRRSKKKYYYKGCLTIILEPLTIQTVTNMDL